MEFLECFSPNFYKYQVFQKSKSHTCLLFSKFCILFAIVTLFLTLKSIPANIKFIIEEIVEIYPKDLKITYSQNEGLMTNLERPVVLIFSNDSSFAFLGPIVTFEKEENVQLNQGGPVNSWITITEKNIICKSGGDTSESISFKDLEPYFMQSETNVPQSKFVSIFIPLFHNNLQI